jgi:hypothetical protein
MDVPSYSNFSATTPYLKYKLYDRLNEINPSVFISIFSGITNSYELTSISNTEYINTKSYSSRIRITSNISGLTNLFTPYTYVDIIVDGGSTGRTLIYDVTDYQIVIEKPIYTSPDFMPSIISIKNIDELKKISDILYEVYLNEDYDWYIEKSNNERKYIYKAYGELLTHNKLFRDNVTGILYENDNNEFILKLYDIENDSDLQFTTVELMFLGADKKTRLPVPYKKKLGDSDSIMKLGRTVEVQIEEDIDWNVLDGGYVILSGSTTLNSPYTNEYFNFGFNNVLGGPNDPPLLYTLIDGNLIGS